MKILVTGATSNIGRAMVPGLRAAGHDVVLSDLPATLPTGDLSGLNYVPCDVQFGVGLERAAAGCDLILHLPAWHGIHSSQKTEADFWNLNVNGTFWMFQAARAMGVPRVVFLSSQAWHGHYNKYGFTKRLGEELCEYHRVNGKIAYVAVRPADLTPWGSDFLRYGSRLLYGGVDRDDVRQCIEKSIAHLLNQPSFPDDPQGLIVNAVRDNVFTAEQVADWESDPMAACERIFPGSQTLLEKYQINISRKPGLTNYGANDERAVGYAPKHHFGTFLAQLRQLDSEGGAEAVAAMRCGY